MIVLFYRGDYAERDRCPIYDTSRYTRGLIPAKPFTYLPIGARLVRLFGTSNLAQIILLHFSEFHPLMYDILDPPAWRNVYDNDGACISWRSTRDFTFPMYRWCQSLPKGQCHLFNVAHCSYDIKSSDVRHLFSNFRLVGIVPGRDGMLVV